MADYTSTRLFAIAAEAGISPIPGDEDPIEDDVFLSFKDKYLQWSEERDQALREYLCSTQSIFRTYLPYSERVLQVASQIVWYNDEIVIADPIASHLSRSSSDTEKDKFEVRQYVQLLSYFRQPIDQGYVLLGGPSLIPRIPEDRPKIVSALLGDQTIADSLKKATTCGYVELEESDGNLTKWYQLHLDSSVLEAASFQIPRESKTKIQLGFGLRLPHIDATELAKKLDSDPFDGESKSLFFAREVHRTLYSLDMARRLGAGVLFDRAVDGKILSAADSQVDPARQRAVVDFINVCVPYIQGIPPERLTDLREKMPTAFLDFRARMFQITREVAGNDAVDPIEIKTRVEAEVLPHLSSLDAEMKAAVDSGKVLTFGGPLVSGVAILAGSLLSASMPALLGLSAAGAGLFLKGKADTVRAEASATGKPYYFLWQARRPR